MTDYERTLWLLVAYIFALFAIVLLRNREEARKTRAHLDEMESRLWQKLEGLDGRLAELHLKHFELFKVRRPPLRA